MRHKHEWTGGADFGMNLRTMLPEWRMFVYCEVCGVEKGADTP